VLKEDESGSLKATVEDILFQAKRKRCNTQIQNNHQFELIVSWFYTHVQSVYHTAECLRVMDKFGLGW